MGNIRKWGWVVLGVAVILQLTQCKKKREVPIPKEVLVKVLADVHIAEAAMYLFSDRIKDSIGLVYHNQIFQIHGITQEDFDQSIEILREDPLLTSIIYTGVYERLDSLDQERLKNPAPPE